MHTNGLTADRDSVAMRQIAISGSSKSFLRREADEDDQEKLFQSYKQLSQKIADTLLGLNLTYKFTHTLVVTILETSHRQSFLSMNFPSFTIVKQGERGQFSLENYLNQLLFSAIQPN